MSAFGVDWVPEAAEELARLWMEAPNRRAVTDAQNRIDQRLAADPHGNGQHRSEGLYRIDEPPLSCTYTIDEAARRVEVTWVWDRP